MGRHANSYRYVMAAACLALCGTGAQAQKVSPLVAQSGNDARVRAYWTPERMQTAVPMEKRLARLPSRTGGAGLRGAPVVVRGAPPALNYDGSLASKLYPEIRMPKSGATMPPDHRLIGTGGLPYTTHRLYPQTDNKLHKIYPYGVVGRLYFTIGSGNYTCSGSVVRQNTIATAGHCTNDGSGNYYDNWMFVPAQNGGKAPYGTWTWKHVMTTSAWANGSGGVPNEQDDAVIVLEKQTYKGEKHKLGDLTGMFGYEFNAPIPNAIAQIGYPRNLDNGEDPTATYSQTEDAGTNNWQWGSTSFGGASGGPEVQDFGQPPDGVPDEDMGGNILTSTTSWTYSDSRVQIDGASLFLPPGNKGEVTFGDLIDYACSVGGC